MKQCHGGSSHPALITMLTNLSFCSCCCKLWASYVHTDVYLPVRNVEQCNLVYTLSQALSPSAWLNPVSSPGFMQMLL